MIAFSQACSYFKNINTELLGLSIDSNQSHLAWVFDIYCKTGVKIPFPIIADRSGEIARKYGMISNSVSNTETVRNVYIIDPNGVIRLILVYPLNVGRCIPEILRSLTALQTADESKGATPANWMPYNPIVNPAPTTVCKQEEMINYINQTQNGMNWYLTFKTPQKCIDSINTESNNCNNNNCEINCKKD